MKTASLEVDSPAGSQAFRPRHSAWVRPMRYFVPDIRLAMEMPAQTRLEDKLGGVPWGLPPSRWPRCSKCGRSQSLLAQFAHQRDRLDLNREGRVLFVFQCNHEPGMCSTWEGGSGANACFVLEPDDMIEGLSPLPPDSPSSEREARILGWLKKDDGITPAQAAAFFEDSEFMKLPDEVFLRAAEVTRLGSVPSWIQSADEGPKDGWRFVGQLDSFYSFFTPPKTRGDGVNPDPQRRAGRTHICQGPNFGDCGIGYVFLRTNKTVPECWFFWQCG